MYKFINTDRQEAIEGRYFNANGFSLAIVASITKGIDWSAYIGSCPSQVFEEETLIFVKDRGCKLSEKDARYFFPDIQMPYRY